LRSSSAYTRRQLLTNCILEVAEEQRIRLATSFYTLFHNASKQKCDSAKAMKEYKSELDITNDELQQQAQAMKQFYAAKDSSASATMYYNDEICETLIVREILIVYVERILAGTQLPQGKHSMKNHQREVAALTNGRITVDDTPCTLSDKLKELLKAAGQTIDCWYNADGTSTAHFLKYRSEYNLRELKIIKYQIYVVLLNWKCEENALHNSSVMGNLLSQSL
jgi:hypothetical protein